MGTKMNDGDDDVGGSPSAVERFRQRVKESTEGSDDDDFEGDGPSEEPEYREPRDDTDEEPVVSTAPSRQQKKQERKKLLDELEETRRANADMAQRLARIEGQQSALIQQRGTPDQTDEDPFDAELEALQAEATTAYQALQAKGANRTQADVDAYNRKARDIEKKKLVIGARMANAQDGIRPVNPNEAIQALLRAENPDIYDNPKAFAFARNEFERMRILGQPDTRQTFEKAMAATREALNIAPPRGAPPSDTRRRQFEGGPRGRSAGSSGGEDRSDAITMTAPLRKIARAAYPGLPEVEAYKKWAKTAGPAFLKATRGK